MLSNEQYSFLIDFIRKASDCKSNNQVLRHFNREKVSIDVFRGLLIKHPGIYPAEPYNETNPDDVLMGQQLIDYIAEYLKRCGLNDCIDYFSPDTYGISSIGLARIDEYERKTREIKQIEESNESAREANLVSKRSNTISWIALGISVVAALTGIAALILEIIKVASGS